MRRLMFRLVGALALFGLMLHGMTLGIAAAEPRSGGEDVVSSYAHESDRVVFSGSDQVGDENPDRTILYMQDLKTGTKTKVFETRDGELGALAISASGGAIAVQVYGHREMTPRNRKVLVLTAEGKEITAFPYGRDFSWSPDSRFLAYTTGEWVGIDTFRPSGTWVYDQTFKTTTKILDKGEFVAWSPADKNLYIVDDSSGHRQIRRYDPRTQTVIQTNRRGIFFSPTGRYYHSGIPRFNEGGVEVYDAQSNQPILRHRPRLAYVLPSARIVGWASEGDVLILEVNRQDLASEAHPQGRLDTVLYDVVHDIARIIPDDSVIGWQNGQALLHNRGKFTKRPLSSLPLLPERPEKPEKPPAKPLSSPQP